MTDTDTLIEIMNNPTSCMKDYHKGRLQGRLDIIEEEMRYFDDSWVSNSENRIASENWQIVQDRMEWLKSERKKIKFALEKEGEQ